MQHLDKRLSVIASLFTPGGRGIDVGTDHGYLPVALVQSGAALSMLATDVRPGPLDSARRCVRENGLEGQIETRLADGLDGLPLAGITDIIIAGMGGQLIAEILSRRVLELDGINLLLQPMTQAPYLRQWLCENGFAIRQERCAVAAGKACNAVIQATFTGEKIPCPPLYALVGRVAGGRGGGWPAPIRKRCLAARRSGSKGLCASASPNPAEIAKRRHWISGLREILAARKEKKGE